MEANLPLLAICRGAQVLNVAAGGTLVQDIPTTVESELSHSVTEPKNLACHDIRIEPGTRLAAVLGPTADVGCSCRVNSRHHQSVARAGVGLVVSARAGDGVVEGIEKPDASFCIGVQWHPENFWPTGEFKPLFDAFVEAARTRRMLPPEGGSHEESQSP
jgi:putative glutamine amidotransferase